MDWLHGAFANGGIDDVCFIGGFKARSPMMIKTPDEIRDAYDIEVSEPFGKGLTRAYTINTDYAELFPHPTSTPIHPTQFVVEGGIFARRALKDDVNKVIESYTGPEKGRVKCCLIAPPDINCAVSKEQFMTNFYHQAEHLCPHSQQVVV